MSHRATGARLRAMTRADLPGVLAIEQACQSTPWSEGNFRDCLQSDYHCQVAAVDGVLAAFMVLSSVLDETHLLNIAVAPAFQRRGLGRWMITEALTEAVSSGITVMYLEVRASNHGARDLYQQLGFQESGRRKNYYRAGDGREDAVLMWAELAPHK
ncbi:ribosomal protein S18-alanine N-acetyltransferase [Alloalcanivorax mobilis]|uniref:ribosomal protein S18-alanine N-acetyltransferase n=1 Tax=Alloalcanivorax mobilis TaxID=2019569 RepID=UPI000B5B3656|nr:ribosomal protein S18-alanine N-acetyltransferase [Alloalcanivorax mobilis]ASK34820.1 ribosomal-protein-alanine N-acetyltransferase [Alcanivorax sp. N3-2A]|tara:strand:- start:14280 stop:14750 length:471 start_codon:yes stop_codon:yes gene_type:complete